MKILIEVPGEMLALAQDPTIWERPYDLCNICPPHTRTCDGPNEDAMTIERRVEWNLALAKKKGLTRQNVSEAAELPLSTVQDFFALRTHDPRLSTAQAISKACSGGSWGQYPCHMAALLMLGEYVTAVSTEEYQEALDEIEEYEKALNDIHLSYKAELDEVRAEAQRKIDHLVADNAKKDAQISKLLDKLLD